MRRFLILGLLLILPLSANADWLRFRGEQGSGIVNDASIPMNWDTGAFLWKKDLDGQGHSSPIIVKGLLILQSTLEGGTQSTISAYDSKTGDLKWTIDHSAEKARTHRKNNMAASTATSDGSSIYYCEWDGNGITLHAVTLEGKPIWEKPLGGFVGQHGAGMSPIVHDGRVFVNYDTDESAAILCFDAKTGDKLWSAERKVYNTCYSTPLIRTTDAGNTELIVGSTAGITGYAAATGKQLWHTNMPTIPDPLRMVASPVLADDLIIATSGNGGGNRNTMALTPGQSDSMKWKKAKDTSYVPMPIVTGKHSYWITDDGFATCLTNDTGRTMWKERVLNSNVSASLVMLGNTIIAIAEDGKSVAFKADPEGLEIVGENDLGEPVFATPAVSDGKLYIRGAATLFCIGN